MKDRRETLKIVGAISSTCAFPFAANELYAQHADHAPQVAAALPSKPSFFSPEEFALISRMADLIIPATTTPGALGAGVPMYIDMVVAKNPAAQRTMRAGMASFTQACRARHGKGFLELDEAGQIALLTPLCEAADNGTTRQPEVAFFKAVKSLTADGYYTSKIGLIDELGYLGNTVHSEFPACTHEH